MASPFFEARNAFHAFRFEATKGAVFARADFLDRDGKVVDSELHVFTHDEFKELMRAYVTVRNELEVK